MTFGPALVIASITLATYGVHDTRGRPAKGWVLNVSSSITTTATSEVSGGKTGPQTWWRASSRTSMPVRWTCSAWGRIASSPAMTPKPAASSARPRHSRASRRRRSTAWRRGAKPPLATDGDDTIGGRVGDVQAGVDREHPFGRGLARDLDAHLVGHAGRELRRGRRVGEVVRLGVGRPDDLLRVVVERDDRHAVDRLRALVRLAPPAEHRAVGLHRPLRPAVGGEGRDPVDRRAGLAGRGDHDRLGSLAGHRRGADLAAGDRALLGADRHRAAADLLDAAALEIRDRRRALGAELDGGAGVEIVERLD